MRYSLFPVFLLALFSGAALADLQWQSHTESQPATGAVTRRVARFQQPQRQAEAAQAPAPAPATFRSEAASPIQQASHTAAAPRPKRAVKHPRRVAAQVTPSESVPTPAPNTNAAPASEMPYGSYESYTDAPGPMAGPLLHDPMPGGAYCEHCGPECSCAFPEPSCAYLDVGCGFADPGCGCIEPGCCDGPSCDFVDPDCCCGEVDCCGDCCGDACGCGDVCWSPWWGRCKDRGAIPICFYLPPIKEVTLFAGVQGFKGPLDAQRDPGNFGFHQGVNVGGKMAWLPWPGLGYQVGYRATQNQLHGTSQAAPYDGSHSQHFITAGLFRRNRVGFNYGVVYDMLRDERVQPTTFNQVRALISVTNCHGHELGFTFAASDDRQDLTPNVAQALPQQYEPVDQYLGFWRYYGCKGGDIRVFGGGGSGLGVLGADINAPLDDQWSLSGGFTYYIPDGSGQVASQEEGWNLGMSLVWHYGCRAKRYSKSCWRPLFDVADNGSFFVDDVD